MSGLPRNFPCKFPGCGKKFVRNEHLNRHALSHYPERQYKCHVCNRSYTRSDVFKRHMKQHFPEAPKPPPKQVQLNCIPCGERKSQCDGGSPCGACTSNWTNCHWASVDISHGAEVNGGNGNTSTSIGIGGGSGQPAVILPSGHSPAAWFSPNIEAWSPGPFQNTTPYSLAPGDLNLSHPQNISGAISYATPESSISATRVEPMQHDTSNRSPQPTSQSTSRQPAAADFNGSTTVPDLSAIFDKNSPSTKRLTELFFTKVHPYWTVLHMPTFEVDNAPIILLASMVMLASWLEGGPEHQKLAPVVYDEVNRIRMDLNPPLYLLQAALFYVVYATCSLTAEGMIARALNLTGLLISTCRYLGIFNGQYTCHEMGDKACDCPFAAWRIQEQLNTLAFSILRIDTYLSVLLDHPPSVRYQEMCIPLPKSRKLWAAANEDERRKLQWNEPAGREKALFSFFMRDALDPNRMSKLPYCLTDIDYHLSICATQTSIWEIARAVHSSTSDELAEEPDHSRRVNLAHPCLTLWRDKKKQDCEVHDLYFSGGQLGNEHVLTPLTFTLAHISNLELYAPLNVLRISGYYYKSRPGSAIPTRKPRAHIRQWTTSGCPRSALWNAAQICRIYSIESLRADFSAPNSSSSPSSRTRAHLKLNPLLIPGVLMSAIVACSYARYTQTCETCTATTHHHPSSPTSTSTATLAAAEAVDLFRAADDDPALEAWKQRGAGVPYWGGGRSEKIPVCKCRLSDIAAWFREAFAEDERAEMEFVLFLAELSRDVT